jgi:two-component system, NarL family, sensor histidine kinase UhpB
MSLKKLQRWMSEGLTTKVDAAAPALSALDPRVASLGTMLLGMLVAWLLGWAVVALNREAAGVDGGLGARQADANAASIVLREAWSAHATGHVFPATGPLSPVRLPDEWAASRPEHRGSVWYRFRFDAPQSQTNEALLAAYIDRACAALDVRLNGQLLYRAGRPDHPGARQCYESHVVPLPQFLLRASDNQLDIKVSGLPLEAVSARQRAGGLGTVRVGAWSELSQRHQEQVFWSVTVSQIIAGILVVLGMFALGMAWVRHLPYLMHFGLLTLTWAALTGRLWLTGLHMPPRAMEITTAWAFALMTAFGVKFLLGYAGHGLHGEREPRQQRIIDRVLVAQVMLMPLSLMPSVLNLFVISRLWYLVFCIEVLAAIVYFLWHAGRSRQAEFWIMSTTLGVTGALVGVELTFQHGLIDVWGWNVTYFVMPMLFAAVAFRLIQVYARALQAAEGARAQLESRVKEISAEIERNFTQIAELRVEQIAEKERKRIAADLHDDLGAKLLTIVHTSESDRISTLAREALEEMRLSVRGLTGRPMRLPDALADWRSEVVSRLGQAGIEVEWRHPLDVMDEPLSARTYVQTTRIIREAVSNVIKHSGASHVVILAEVGEHEFEIAIQDNGKGITQELDGRLDRGHGMASMKHRAKQLNGQCLVESGPGFGTVIRMTLPLEIESVASALTPGHPGATSAPGTASMQARGSSSSGNPHF